MVTVTFPVSGMTCAACSARVQRALEREQGVLFHHSTGDLEANAAVYGHVTVAAEVLRTGVDAPELLMCTESPLAVQCCFDGGDDQLSEISLTELADCPDTFPLKDAEGRHYLSEIAVTWCADQYWSDLAKEINQ